VSSPLNPGKPDGASYRGSVPARTLSAKAVPAQNVNAPLGFIGALTDWCDAYTMGHALNDADRARRWLLAQWKAA